MTENLDTELIRELRFLAEKLLEKQQDLGAEFERVLMGNAGELYEE